MSFDQLSEISKRQLNRAIGEAFGQKPLEVTAQLAERTWHYKEYLYRLACGSWLWSLPDYWNDACVKNSLILCGAVAVAQYKGADIPFPFTVIERDIQHLPRKIFCADGGIKFNDDLIIGENCEIITLGFIDRTCTAPYTYAPTIDIYAQALADIDASRDVNLLNTRTPYIFEVSNNKEADDMKLLYTRIMEGKPAVFWRRHKTGLDKTPPTFATLPVKQNYISDELCELKTAIIGDYLSEIGIKNINYEKKERLITDEVTAPFDMINAAITGYADSIKRGCEKVNKMFGLNISIKPIGEDGEVSEDDYARSNDRT